MIDLSTTTARALRHLVTIGMTQSTVEKYSYSGFGYIVRHFEEIGISYVTPDILDSFLLEQDRLFELGELSYRQISLIRRSCDLLKYCSENNITNFTPSTPWMRTVCRPWQSITKTPPTSEQISDPGNVYTLAWKVNNAIMSFGYSKATCMHYRLEGIEAILNDFYLEGLSHFSVDFLNRIVEEKRVQYVQGLVCASTYHCFRKVAIWMQEMHETGSITTTKVPNWGLRELSETYLSVFKYFFSDPELIERLAESSLKTARYAIRKFLFELEDKGYTSLSDINRNNVNTCITLLAKKYTSGLSTVIYFLRVCKNSPSRHLSLPAMIKLLYCCGLRPCEARRLYVKDVDLIHGRLNILDSKHQKSRIVMMTDDVTEMLSDYNAAMTAIMPERDVFFPAPDGSIYNRKCLEKPFRQALKVAEITGVGERIPRLYDFRHTFATHSLYRWMREGKDVSSMIPYLSSYMGHSLLSDTYYYIHFVPGLFEEMSGFDFSSAENLLPEVDIDE